MDVALCDDGSVGSGSIRRYISQTEPWKSSPGRCPPRQVYGSPSQSQTKQPWSKCLGDVETDMKSSMIVVVYAH